MAPHQHPAPASGEGAGPAVGIADGDKGQPGGPLGGKGSVVPRRFPGLKGVDLGHPGPEGEDRAQVCGKPGGILGGAQKAIQGNTGPHPAAPRNTAVIQQAIAALEMEDTGFIPR